MEYKEYIEKIKLGDCPNHRQDKVCRIDGCNNIGISKGICKVCGNRRQRPICSKHEGHEVRKYKKYKKEFCENCLTRNNLTVHHLDCNRFNNDPQNLQTLCVKCHENIHNS